MGIFGGGVKPTVDGLLDGIRDGDGAPVGVGIGVGNDAAIR
jgi:hypothetical protein